MPYDPLAWLDDELARWERAGLRRRLIERTSAQQPGHLAAQGDFINFAANDYLALAGDPRLAAAVRAALAGAGWGAGASPLVTGRASLHAQLEAEIARFEGAEAALLFTSGYAANLGAISSLVGRNDAIFSDAKNHASIIDGARLSRAEVAVYPHNDVDALRSLLTAAPRSQRKLIVTDSLFSMDGDLAPLPQLAQLAEAFDAMLLIDEAHATGVFGATGRGAAEHLLAEHPTHIRVGTLSKALGCAGGFVAGPQRLIDFLANRARSFVFSTASPEATAAASREALKLVREEPFRREELLAAADELRRRLTEQGWSTGDSESQIIPIIIGEPQATMDLAAQLRKEGIFAPGIRPPTVAPGESRLRISLSYGHRPEHVERLLAALANAPR